MGASIKLNIMLLTETIVDLGNANLHIRDNNLWYIQLRKNDNEPIYKSYKRRI